MTKDVICARPSIEQVFEAFHQFHCRHNAINMSTSPFRQPVFWQEQMDASTETLRLDLDRMGIAEHIDWSRKE